jgi:hypothetical protein
MKPTRNKLTTMPNNVAFADNSKLARNKRPPLRITRRIREAIDVMVERGLDFQAAAHEAKLTTRHMRMQLSKPHVIAYYREQCHVFRASTTEQTNNKQTNASPGVTINIVHGSVSGTRVAHDQTTIDAKADDSATTEIE